MPFSGETKEGLSANVPEEPALALALALAPDKEKGKADPDTVPEPLSPSTPRFRICPVCGSLFPQRTAMHKYCTPDCWQVVNKKQTFRPKP